MVTTSRRPFFVADNAPSIFRKDAETSAGDYLHHIQPIAGVVSPERFDALCRRYEECGYAKVYSLTAPAPAAGDPPRARAAFFDSVESIGCFTEVVQKDAAKFDTIRAIYDAHLDGTEEPLLRPWPSTPRHAAKNA